MKISINKILRDVPKDLTQFGLLSKALDGSLYEEDTLSYNSILVSTVPNQNVVIRLRVWQ